MDTFDAVAIEDAFEYFFGADGGSRATAYDADVFRAGKYKELAAVLQKFVDAASQRLSRIPFTAEESKPSGPKTRLEDAIKSLAYRVENIREQKQDEREDYHWEIIAQLVIMITAFFEYAESRSPT